MADITIVRSDEVEAVSLPGTTDKEAGWLKRIMYPPRVNTKGSFLAVVEAGPGYSPHRWHRHVRDKGEGYEIIYPKDFEEIYYIVRGSGVVQWKMEDGQIQEEKVSAGDSIYFPAGVPEHQLLNTGTERMFIVACGKPTAKTIWTK